MNKKHAWGCAGLALALLLGTAIRVGPISHRPLWFDEGDTYEASAPQTGITYDRFFRWTNHFENAPLSFLLSRVSMDVTGSQKEWAMRLPALIAGILCIAAAYGLGRVTAGPVCGGIMALLAAVDPNMVDQSEQCRMYTLLMLFTLVGAAWSIRLLRKPDAGKWEWLMPGLMMGLCLWSTLLGTMMWAALALGVGLLLAGGRIAGRRHAQAGKVVCGFLFAGFIAVLTAQTGVFLVFYKLFSGKAGRGANMHAPGIAREIVVAMKDLVGPHWPAMVVVYPLAAVGLWLLARRCKSSAAILIGLAGATLVMLFPFRKQNHFMDPRYLTVAEPSLWAGLAMLPVGLFSARAGDAPAPTAGVNPAPNAARKPLAILAALAVAAVIAANLWQATHLAGYWQQPEKYDFARMMLAVKDRMKPGDALAIDPPTAEVLTRYYRITLDPVLDDALHTKIDGHRWAQGPHVPDSFAAPATWLVIGNVDDTRRIGQADGAQPFDPEDPRYLLNPIQAIARHYGQTVDVATFKRHVRLHQVAVVRFDREGVKWYAVEDLAKPAW